MSIANATKHHEHPGAFAVRLLQQHDIELTSKVLTNLATRLCTHESYLTAFLKGERDIDAPMALALSRYFSTSWEFWFELQVLHDGPSQASIGYPSVCERILAIKPMAQPSAVVDDDRVLPIGMHPQDFYNRRLDGYVPPPNKTIPEVMLRFKAGVLQQLHSETSGGRRWWIDVPAVDGNADDVI